MGDDSCERRNGLTRRDLIAALLTLPVLAVRYPIPAFAQTRRRARVRPGDPQWPGREAWATLKERVAGNLIQPAPVVATCERDAGSVQCEQVKKALRNPYYLGDQPAGTQLSGWLDAWSPQPSAYAVVARNAADVAAAVNFARDRNIRLVVKGGGHSYQGTSNAPDSLLVWTRQMRSITIHDRFVPQNCANRVEHLPAVSVEAGAMWMDVYDAVTTWSGRYVQGGGCATVGVAGLIQSGGFGSFSKRYGLAAASLLEAEVVTADGRVRTVNECRDADLFWALKGGGGGTFGIVTRVTLRTHELPTYFGGVSATIRALSDAAFAALVSKFVEFYATQLFNPHWGESVSIRADRRLQISMVSQGLTKEEGESLWRPFFDWVTSRLNEYAFDDPPSIGVRAASSWWDAQTRRSQGSTSVIFDDRPDVPATHAWWSGDQDQVSAFIHGYESLWLPDALLEPGRQGDLSAALVAASRHMTVALHFNKGLAGAPADVIQAASATAMNPAVTTAFALAIIATGGPSSYLQARPTQELDRRREDAHAVDRAGAELLRVAPGSGSYVSESNFFNRQWQRAYWGSHYPRLVAIKAKYDSSGLFYVHHGVGSDDWQEGGFTRS
jgi:FAD/FMN-containing dehydrogenase